MNEIANPFDQCTFGVCVVDLRQGALYCNKSCSEICECPLQSGEPIENPSRCVISDLRKSTSSDGAQFMRGMEHHGKNFDLFYVREANREYFFLFPLESKLREATEMIEPLDLTDREKEIFSFLILGLSNERICERAGVSRNTLKSHLKAIYRKIPPRVSKLLPPERLAAMREKYA